MYAIIQLAGKQYRVTQGDTLTVNRLEDEVNASIKADVLLKADGAKVEVGEPLVSGTQVTLKVLEHSQGDKLRVAKYKSKSRYRRVRGHRQQLTTLEVVKIG